MVYSKLYNKLSYARILIGSHLWSIGGKTYFVIIKTFLNSLLYKTNRFQVVVLLFSNRSQRTSKCGKNKVAHEAQPARQLGTCWLSTALKTIFQEVPRFVDSNLFQILLDQFFFKRSFPSYGPFAATMT